MDNQEMQNIVHTYGTPCFVFDEISLERRMKEVKTIVGSNVHLCYSIKANPFLISKMKSLVELLEVCSPGELEICNAIGIAPDMILFSGVNKTREDIENAICYGVRRFTAESLLHVKFLNEAALRHNISLQILLRLTAGSQFGMDKNDLLNVISKREHLVGLTIEGIHYFAGTQRKKLSAQRKEIAMLVDLIDELKADYGFNVQKIEYGPGLFYPYFVNEDNTDTLAPLRELQCDLVQLNRKVELTIEMGRFFASECGTYLTTVVDTKTNLGSHYAILDGGIHHVNYYGGNMGLRLPHIKFLHSGDSISETSKEWILCGSLCTTADIIVRSVPICGLAIGDVLAFENIGAYSVTEGPCLFLSRNMPRILLRNEEGIQIARDVVHTSMLNCPDFLLHNKENENERNNY